MSERRATSQRLCIGTWFAGRQISASAVESVLNTALNLGIYDIDTSPRYLGAGAERLLGDWLSKFDNQVVHVHSKVYLPNSLRTENFTKALAHVRHSLEQSCQHLRVSVVKSALIETGYRSPNPEMLAECIAAMLDSKRTQVVGIQWPDHRLLSALRARLPEQYWRRLKVFIFYNSLVAEELMPDFRVYREFGLKATAYGIFCGGGIAGGKRVPDYAQRWLDEILGKGEHSNMGRSDRSSGDYIPPAFYESLKRTHMENCIDTVILGTRDPTQLIDLVRAWRRVSAHGNQLNSENET